MTWPGVILPFAPGLALEATDKGRVHYHFPSLNAFR